MVAAVSRLIYTFRRYFLLISGENMIEIQNFSRLSDSKSNVRIYVFYIKKPDFKKTINTINI